MNAPVTPNQLFFIQNLNTQVLGVLFLIFNIIGMISNIVALSNTKSYYSKCLTTNAAYANLPDTSTTDPFMVPCDDNMPVNIDTLKYWDKVSNTQTGYNHRYYAMYQTDYIPLYNLFYVLTCFTSFHYLSTPCKAFVACYNYMYKILSPIN